MFGEESIDILSWNYHLYLLFVVLFSWTKLGLAAIMYIKNLRKRILCIKRSLNQEKHLRTTRLVSFFYLASSSGSEIESCPCADIHMAYMRTILAAGAPEEDVSESA